jgi:signal transduction histidine kinase
LNYSTSTNEEDKDNIRIATTCGEILITLIGNALDATKLEAGKVELDYHETDILDILKRVTSISKLKAKEKKISLKLYVSKNLPKIISIDSARLT